jgi:hypothetical protein
VPSRRVQPSRRLSELALTGCGAAAAAFLLLTHPAHPVRAISASFLLVLAVLSITFAGQADHERRNWAGSPLLAGMALLLLGCIELRGALVHVDRLQASSERLRELQVLRSREVRDLGR